MDDMRFIDMHCDTIGALYHKLAEKTEETDAPLPGLRRSSFHIDLEKLKKAGYLLQNFAVFIFLREDADPFAEALHMIDLYYRELEANRDLIAPVYSWKDIEANRAAGKLSAMLTLEEGGMCKGDLAYLRLLHRLGARMMTLTWNFPNELAWPNVDMSRKLPHSDPAWAEIMLMPQADHGLTEKGLEFLAEMERLGMIIDVSHLSDAGFYDVLHHTTKPFVASHSNARSICPHIRNLTDGMIRALAERGGVTGLNFCADFLSQVPHGEKNPGTIAAVAAHARHIVNVGGIECLGLGTDFDGISTHEELPDASYVPLLMDALKKAGFTESDIDHISRGNVLRVYQDILD